MKEEILLVTRKHFTYAYAVKRPTHTRISKSLNFLIDSLNLTSRFSLYRLGFSGHLPTLAFRNLLPMRVSVPTAWATSVTSAPVISQMADIALILEILCAKNALAA